MKIIPPSPVLTLILAAALAPVVSRADYMPAERQLARLESIMTLTAVQEQQALQIFQNLKDIMDSLTPADQDAGKGMQANQVAREAIRSVLTPEQQAVYDRTPQRLGGGSYVGTPAMRALNAKVRALVQNYVRNSASITTQVGGVQKVTLLSGATFGTDVVRDDGLAGSPPTIDEFPDGPEAAGGDVGEGVRWPLPPRPGKSAGPGDEHGWNVVRVVGSAATKAFKVEWTMDSAGKVAVTAVIPQ